MTSEVICGTNRRHGSHRGSVHSVNCKLEKSVKVSRDTYYKLWSLRDQLHLSTVDSVVRALMSSVETKNLVGMGELHP